MSDETERERTQRGARSSERPRVERQRATIRDGGGAADARAARAAGRLARPGGRRAGGQAHPRSPTSTSATPTTSARTCPARGCSRASTSAPTSRGLHNIPAEGPVLLVGNHSGGNMTPDTTVFTLAFTTYFGVERRFHQLAHNLVLAMPGLGFLRKYGTVAAGHENARKALQTGRRGARLPRRRLRGAPAVVGRGQGRLRRPQGLHPARARGGRADRPDRLDRRPGDRALPVARRAARQAAAARQAVPPEGAADLARAAVGAERRRHARPPAAAGEDLGARARSRSTSASSSATTRTSTRSTTTSSASCRPSSTSSPSSAGCR